MTPSPRDLMRRGATFLLALLFILGARAVAEAEPVHGRFEIQVFGTFSRKDTFDGILAGTDRHDVLANLRLTWAPEWDKLRFEVHYVLRGQYGDGVPLTRF